MNIHTIISNIAKRFERFIHLSDNPKGERYTFINDINTIKKAQLKEYKIWYVGDSNELLNYYLGREFKANAQNSIYNRNKEQYFWAISETECGIKRVHNDLATSLISTLSDVVGFPVIKASNPEDDIRLQEILEENDFQKKLTQEIRPLTMVEGWGSYKLVFDKSVSQHPIIQFYEAIDTDYLIKHERTIGVIYEDYYKYNDKDYMLLEIRRIVDNGSKIDWELFRVETDEEFTKVSLNTIPELKDLPEDGIFIENIKTIFGGTNKYLCDVQNKNYGRSFYQGKLDIFDDLDQAYSQASQTCRVSTPVEYYPADLLKKNSRGEPILPHIYNRQYIKSLAVPNGDGDLSSEIKTTQPVLNFQQYNDIELNLIKSACQGVLSPASLGLDLTKRDNADAQREKQNQTIQTRNNIIASETKTIKELCKKLLMLDDYMRTGLIDLNKDYDISVSYSGFANPSFESLSETLTPMFTNGAISPEMYVDKLYINEDLSDEAKEREITYLREKSNQDNLNIGDFEIDGINKESIGEDSIE